MQEALSILGLVFQMALTAENDWNRIRGFDRLTDVINGVKFQDGISIIPEESANDPANEQQKVAA